MGVRKVRALDRAGPARSPGGRQAGAAPPAREGGRAPAKAAVIPAGITAPPSLSPPPRLVLGLGPETAEPWVMGRIAGRSDWRKGEGDGQEDCGGVHGSGRRLCRR